MRRKKRVKVVEMPLNDPEVVKYVVKRGIPVEIPAPQQVPVERPAQYPLQEPKKWTPS
jgi:hypothetical protein